MGLQHHSIQGDSELIRRFIDQQRGTAKREYEHGRLSADDDGSLAYAIRVDDKHRSIVIDFGKHVTWIGLDMDSAIQLRDALTERIMYLQGIREPQNTKQAPEC